MSVHIVIFDPVVLLLLLCLLSGGVYRLKCNTCNKVYVGQSGRAITKRFKEHIRYIKTNNPTSAYVAHILQNIHEFGTEKDTMHLIKACQKSSHMDSWEALYMYAYRKQQTLIGEQQVNDTNAIFDLASINPPRDTHFSPLHVTAPPATRTAEVCRT